MQPDCRPCLIRPVFDPAGVASKLLATPVGYELLMSGGPGSALNETSPMAVWWPAPPAGYTALGSVVTPSASTKPRLEDLRVLRNDCVAQCPAFMLWCNVKMPGQCPMFNPAMPAATTGGADWSTAVYTSGADLSKPGAATCWSPCPASGRLVWICKVIT